MTVWKDQSTSDMSSHDKGEPQGAEAKKKAEQNGLPAADRQPSTGKQLPSIPADAGAAGRSGSGLSASGHQQSFGPFLTEYALMAEYNLLLKKSLPGVYAIPSYKSPLVWFGVLFVRQGPYQEGVFKFTLYIPDNYPDSECPRIVFDHCVFHPVIHPHTGELDVARAYPKWRRGVNHLWEVLMYARRVFHKIETKEPQNAEAGALYENDMTAFKERVQDTVLASRNKLYDAPLMDDPHAIRFSSWDPEVHEEARHKMLAPKERVFSGDLAKNAQTSGLSWMKPGALRIFSQQDSAS